MSNIIDCTGLKCPQPVINTKKYFDSIEAGEGVIIVDNEVAKNNISKLATSNGFKFEVNEMEGLFHIKINKEVDNCKVMKFDDQSLVILVSTDKLGSGNDELGTLLMKSYLFALSEADKIPTDLIFLNAGVKLTAEGSESLESIKKLHSKGVNVMSCGTCLDFYNLKEKLQVGEISNMYTIVEKTNGSGNTIKL
jgi:selenium metabolism protein YedF